jgi:hypothetical protein
MRGSCNGAGDGPGRIEEAGVWVNGDQGAAGRGAAKGRDGTDSRRNGGSAGRAGDDSSSAE